MKKQLDARDLALTAVFASLYAIMVVVQGLSAAAALQLRIADALIPLAALFGWPSIVGLTVGCFVSNTFISAALPNGVYDIFFGPLANLMATFIVFRLRKRKLVGCILGAVTIGLIVGSYLWLIFTPSDIFGFKFPSTWPIWATTVFSITVSSLIAIGIIGYVLLVALSNPNVIEPLKSRGLKVIE